MIQINEMGPLELAVDKLIVSRYRSRAKFARSIGMSKNTLYTMLKKGFARSSLDTILPVVDALDLNLEEFARGRAVSNADATKSVPVPLYGEIAAGLPVEAIPISEMYPLPAHLHSRYPRAFMLRVKGSLMNRELPEGYYVLINPCTDIEMQGAIYAVAVGRGEATLKHVRKLANGLLLLPNSDDPTNHEMVIDFADPHVEDVRIIGRAVWHCPPTEDPASI